MSSGDDLNERPTPPTSPIEWGVAARPLPGEVRSGDHYAVAPFPNGVLVAAVDGLGHGDEAADAARLAVATLAADPGMPIRWLVERCHERLRRTRGVAMSLASINALDETMTWLGVGNVEGVLLRADLQILPAAEHVPLRGGVVGYRLPSLHAETIAIRPGDTVVFATDGIRSGFAEGLLRSAPPQRLADRILAEHARSTDDALVLVVRYQGRLP